MRQRTTMAVAAAAITLIPVLGSGGTASASPLPPPTSQPCPASQPASQPCTSKPTGKERKLISTTFRPTWGGYCITFDEIYELPNGKKEWTSVTYCGGSEDWHELTYHREF